MTYATTTAGRFVMSRWGWGYMSRGFYTSPQPMTQVVYQGGKELVKTVVGLF